MIPPPRIAAIRGEKSALALSLERDTEIVERRVDGRAEVLHVPLPGAVLLGAEQVEPAHPGMPVGGEVDRHRVADVGKQLIARRVDHGAEVLHAAKVRTAYDPRSEEVLATVSADGFSHEIEVLPVGRNRWVSQQRDRVLQHVRTMNLAPCSPATQGLVDLSRARLGSVDGAECVVHRVAISGERGRTLIILAGHWVLHLLRLCPEALLILLGEEERIVFQPRDSIDGILMDNPPGGVEVNLIVFVTIIHGAALAAPRIEDLHAGDLVKRRPIAPSDGRITARQSQYGTLIRGRLSQIFAVIPGGLVVASLFLTRLTESEAQEAVRIIVTEGIEVGTDRSAVVVYALVAVSHAVSDVSAQVLLIGLRLGVELPIHLRRGIVLSELLFFLGILQLDRLARRDEADQQAADQGKRRMFSNCVQGFHC